jgi:hypothetical protein
MKKLSLALIFLLIFAGCVPSNKKLEQVITDPDIVTVYYFHGKQRCKTCVAVQDVAREIIKTNFSGNTKVHFVEINTSEKGNEALIEKYEVTWNALIIAKGEVFIDITDQAFATAVENPQKLESLIKEEVNKRLK